jgi:GT2 family glycosyltransferase
MLHGTVSVVLPTLNRYDVVLKTIREPLSGDPASLLEIIVVDQSDEPLNLDRSCEDPRLRYVHTPIKNLPRARNIGARIAAGEIVLYLDDDVTGVRDIVARHRAAHEAVRADIVTGPIFEARDHPSLSDAPRRAGRHPIPEPGFAPGGNASYRRDAIFRAGGFDENFTGGAVGEDAEMSHRVRQGGGTIVLDHQCGIIHLNIQSGGCKNESAEMDRLSTRITNCHYFWHKVGDRRASTTQILTLIRANAIVHRPASGGLAFFPPDRLPKLLGCWIRARRRTRVLLAKPQTWLSA